MTNLTHLIRLRWAVRGTAAAVTAVSVVANVLHAQPNPVSQGIAAWPPICLLFAIELISRIPATAFLRAGVRIAGTVVIAAGAAWISYWHMVGTVAAYGETDASPYIWPLTVDGLMVVASVSLVELAIQIRELTDGKPIMDVKGNGFPVTSPVEIEGPALVHPVAAVEQLTAAAVAAPVSPAPAGMAMRPGAFGIPVAKPLPPARRPVRDIRLLTPTTN